MSIRNRLTLLFTAIVAVIFTAILSAIYLLSVNYSESSFYDRLRERAFIAYRIYLEKNQLSKQLLVEFEQEDLEKLSREVLQIYDKQNNVTFISTEDNWKLTQVELNQIKKLKKLNFKKENRYVVGVYHQENNQEFIVVASAIDKVGSSKIKQLQLVIIISFSIGLIIIYLSGHFFANNALNPMNDVMTQVKQITDSNLSMRVSAGNENDEIGRLTRTFNEMLDRIEGAFEAQRSFASLASHELRTPLTAIIGELQVLNTRDRSTQDYKKGIEKALEEAKLLKNIIDDLLVFTRTHLQDGEGMKEIFRIDELLWEIQDTIFLRNKTAKLKLILNQMPENQDLLKIQGNIDLMRVALNNVVENALKYSNNQEVICEMNWYESHIKINIIDTGIGIPAEDLKRITEPFYRAENARTYTGSGIGLALTQKIIQKHQGEMRIRSNENQGTTVSISLPTQKHSPKEHVLTFEKSLNPI
ncbi:sensor histidine kinase [Thermoflexibacter ruber]|uniref:histidine kinase n=1 Tax=Thermoflexibacter ruber TaxID=1003 RepID=A0A1I2ESM4_9BACT|nr:HAMP domain-containing sensor histidine kinase [Thermoflexibacter ruber]SFE95723.1 Signal transduction histidine kinase [Thermoflexibacter ruber]